MLTTTIISGTATAFATSYVLFLVGIYFSNFSTIGMGTVMYCWMMEILSGREKVFKKFLNIRAHSFTKLLH